MLFNEVNIFCSTTLLTGIITAIVTEMLALTASELMEVVVTEMESVLYAKLDNPSCPSTNFVKAEITESIDKDKGMFTNTNSVVSFTVATQAPSKKSGEFFDALMNPAKPSLHGHPIVTLTPVLLAGHGVAKQMALE